MTMKLLRTLISFLLIAPTACGTLHSEPSAAAASSPPQAAIATQPANSAQRMPLGSIAVEPTPAAVANLSNVVCRKQHKDWNPECVWEDFNIRMFPDGCGDDGFYGTIESHGAPTVTLWDRFPRRSEATPIVKLKNGQFVCIGGSATRYTGGERLWLYVTAIPTQTVKACAGNDNCKSADLPIEWIRPMTGHPCRLSTTNQYVGDCPSGWVQTREVGEFSMGL